MRQQGIIIRTYPSKEADQVIICYTRDMGKQRYRAKSSLLPTSKQGPHLQVLNHIDFSLVEGNGWHGTTNYPILTSTCALNTFGQLRGSLQGMATASFFLECFDKLVFDNEPDEQLWEFLLDTLALYNQAAREHDTDWRKMLKDRYEAFMEVMGYHSDTQVHELHHTQFSSLRFLDNVLR